MMLLLSGVPAVLYGVVDAEGMVMLEGTKLLPDCRDTEVEVVTSVVSSVTDTGVLEEHKLPVLQSKVYVTSPVPVATNVLLTLRFS